MFKDVASFQQLNSEDGSQTHIPTSPRVHVAAFGNEARLACFCAMCKYSEILTRRRQWETGWKDVYYHPPVPAHANDPGHRDTGKVSDRLMS